MSSTWRQRFFDTPKENRARPFKGRVHMLVVCLNYEGTEAPLTCTVDGDRLVNVASGRGVKDIVKLYDDGSTDGFPCRAELEQAIGEMAGRCKRGDFFVFVYSGHGTTQENEEEACGVDSMLCLRSRDGEEEDMVDDDLAKIISERFHEEVKVLVLADCCHSAGVLDCDTPGIWGARRVCALSGCQDLQCSDDTGDGGAMTNALLRVLRRKGVRRMRKERGVSIQYIFNRMVDVMPDEEDDEDEEEDEDDEEDSSSSASESEEDEDDEGSDEEEDDEDEVEPGQHINLSWPGGCDPSKIPFPF